MPGAGAAGRPARNRRVTLLAAGLAALLVALAATAVLADPFGLRKADGDALAPGPLQAPGPQSDPGGTTAADAGPAGKNGTATAAPAPPSQAPVGTPRDWFAFKRFDDAAAVNESPLVVVDPDGGQRQIATGDEPALAPDASRVAFVAGGQIVTARPDGTDARQLTDESGASAVSLAWSPDGRSIAYFRNTGGLYVINADGTGRRLVADVSGGEPSWSPDGTRIVFRRFSEPQRLEIVSLDGSARQLTGPPVPGAAPVQPRWSPDGASIVFSTAGGGIYRISPDGSDLRRLAGAGTWHPSWSPDGDIVFVQGDPGARFFNATGAVHTMRPDGSDVRPLELGSAGGPVSWARQPAGTGS